MIGMVISRKIAKIIEICPSYHFLLVFVKNGKFRLQTKILKVLRIWLNVTLDELLVILPHFTS